MNRKIAMIDKSKKSARVKTPAKNTSTRKKKSITKKSNKKVGKNNRKR